MTHLAEQSILEARDGFPLEGSLRVHLDECVECRSRLEQAHARAAEIGSALGALDESFDVASARDAVRARLRAPRPRRSLVPLGRAAALLLVAAGAASALPGSPVRSWLVSSADDASASAVEQTPAAVAPQRAGVSVPAATGPLEVRLDGVPNGTVIDVLWVSDGSATVYANAESTFQSSPGAVRVEVVPGPVTVELPRSALASIRVNGRMYLERTPAGLSTPGPVTEAREDGVTFRTPAG